MFRPTLTPLVIALSCLSPMLGCATAEQPPMGGSDPSDSGGGGSGGVNATGGSGTQGGTNNSGGKPGSGGTLGASGSTGNAGSAGAAHGGASGSGGASAVGGAPAGGAGGSNAAGTSSAGTSSAGTSSAGTSAGGTTGSAGTTGAAGTSAGGGSGTVLFSDDFEDGNSTGWVTSGGSGVWAIVTDGTKAYAQTATGTGSSVLSSAAGSTTWTDQIVEARVKVLAFGGQSTSYYAAIFARYDGTDYYSVLLRSDGKLVIRKDTSSIGNAVSVGIVAGTWYTVRLECVGSTIKAYLNGVLQSTVTDATISSGGIAVSVDNATAEFDDVKVTKP